MAEKVVVDTSILVEALERGDEKLLLKLAQVEGYVPYVALYEYLWGYIYLGRDHGREKQLVEKLFTVVYPDQDVLVRAAEIDVELAKRGQRVPQADILIAATALVLGAPLLTRDVEHFRRFESFGLKVLTEL